MSRSSVCPGCGLELPVNGWMPDPSWNASGECREVLAEVQGFELHHRELVRDHHQMTVDAYLAQHAVASPRDAVPSIGLAYSLVGLHLALDRGVPGPEVRAVHQRMGRPDATWPHLPRPQAGAATTVFDVAAAGVMVGSVAGHAEVVRRWAADVWAVWAPRHGAVAGLAERFLGPR